MFTWLVSMLTLCSTMTSTLTKQLELPRSISRSSWTTEHGLPQNSVTGICQDSAGYIWVSTFGGLARFDGRRFEAFSSATRDDIQGSRLHQALVDRDGALWTRLVDVGLYRFEGDQFELVETPSEPRQLHRDQQGRIWLIFDGGVGCFRDGHIETVRAGTVRGILPTRDGAFWFSTAEGDLVHHDGAETLRLTHEHGLPGEPIPALFVDSSGGFWAGNRRGIWYSPDHSTTPFARVEGVVGPAVSLAEGDDGAIWIGCRGGLYRWDPIERAAESIAQGDFTNLLMDERDNLWAGSPRGGGLRCLRSGPLHDATQALGLDVADTWSITGGRVGAVVLVQESTVFEAQLDSVKRSEVPNNSRSALVDSHDTLWVGQTDGLIMQNAEGERKYGQAHGLVGGVRAIFESRAGVLWAGTNRGLYRRDGERFTRVHPEQLANLRCMIEGREDGVLWVGMQEGLARLEDGEVHSYTSEDGLSRGSVRTLHLDRDGVLWAGSYGGGLSRIEGDSIHRYTQATGLANDFLGCILEDDDDRLWINSNSGPFVVRRADLNLVARGELERVACVTFTREEGAREANGGNQPSGWRAPDGRMWFPSIEGVTVADPRELPLDEVAPTVRIEHLDPHEDRSLDARFTGLGFSSPERVLLQYRLDGHDSEWHADAGRGEVHYSYLRPGSYDFRVRARNGFGPWSATASWSFEVEPRFHETKTFIAIIVVLVVLSAFGLAEQRIKHSRERTAELMRLVEERERAERSLSRSRRELSRLSRELLTNQEVERRHLSRELHDDVTQRVAALAIQAEVTEARLDTATDQTRDRLRGMVENAQQLAGDVQQLSRRLHPVGLRTLGLTEAIRQECAAFTRRDGIAVELDEDLASDEVSEEVAVAVFRILQESLHNIEKHAHAKSVDITLVLDGKELIMTIADHGRGFETETGMEIGLGLITMRERASSIGGELSIISHPNEGTTVHLRAPSHRSSA